MTTITKTDDYKLEAYVHPIDSYPEHFHIRLRSSLATAKNPTEERTVFQATVSRSGAEALGREIYQALAKGKP